MSSNGLDLKGGAACWPPRRTWRTSTGLYLGGGLTATARKALKERFGDRRERLTCPENVLIVAP